MLNQLTLTNFRRHKDLTINFTAGLQLLRGSNEAGKTTVVESILYALFGTRALRSKLESVVSRGEKESSLKVVLSFAHDGVDYQITRSKSGAELLFGESSVTGQSETRAFLERLFGCTADLAAKLMFASQNDVRGVLSEGPTAAAGMVERLANLGVIETLVDKITANLPSGNTRTIQVQLVAAKQQLAELQHPGEADTSALSQAKAKLTTLQKQYAVDKESLAAFDLDGANATLQAARSAQVVVEANAKQRVKWQAVLREDVPVSKFTSDGLDKLQLSQANAVENNKLWLVYSNKADCPAWVDTEAANEELAKLAEESKQLDRSIAGVNQEVAVFRSQKITQSACGLCGKELQNIPEVVSKNAEFDTKISKLEEQLSGLRLRLMDNRQKAEALSAVVQAHNAFSKAHGRYWKLTENGLQWLGTVPSPPLEVDNVNVAAERALLRQIADVESRKQQASKALADLVDPQVPDTSAALKVVSDFQAATAALETLKQSIRAVENEVIAQERLLMEHTHKLQTYELQKVTYEKQIAGWEDMLRQTDFHNEIIRKLRASRQSIASQLWNSVLSVVSHTFTQIRGSDSRVERGPEGFTVNGQAVADLSGSTIDMLGLAIRLSLSRVFLPNLPFIFLDEIFAGCDQQRELAGLSALAASGIPQVLLVTHSDLGDGLAANLVQL